MKSTKPLSLTGLSAALMLASMALTLFVVRQGLGFGWGSGGAVLVIACLALLAVQPPEIQHGGRLALFTAGAGLLFLGQAIGRGHDHDMPLWAGGGLMAGACLLLLSADRKLPAATKPEIRNRRWEGLCFALIFVFCVFLRFWNLGLIPENIWFDEASFANTALDKVLIPGKAPLYFGQPNNNPGMFFWVLSAFLKWGGLHLWTLRSMSALFGCLSLFPFYYLARRWFSLKLALAGLLIYGSMRWGLIFQRTTFMAPLANFWMLSTLALIAKGMEMDVRKSRFVWALAGVCLGISFYCYLPIRLLPAFLVVFFLLDRFLGKPPVKAARLWLFAAAALVLALPLLNFAFRHWQQFSGYSGQVSVFSEIRTHGWHVLWQNLKAHLLMFEFHGDANGRHNLAGLPQLDVVTGALFLPGLLWAHWRFVKDPRARLMVLWFWAMLSAGFLSMSSEAPQAHRSVLLLPMVPLAILLFAEKCGSFLAQVFSRDWPTPVRVALLSLLLLVPAFNFYEYFILYPSSEATWRSLSPRATAMARRMAAQDQGWELHASDLNREYQFFGYELQEMSHFILRQQGRQAKSLWILNSLDPLHPPASGVFCIWGDSDKDMTASAAKQFPDLAMESPLSPEDSLTPLYHAMAIPKDRIPTCDLKEATKHGYFVYYLKPRNAGGITPH